jgi:polysaccharide export outer membrane protein
MNRILFLLVSLAMWLPAGQAFAQIRPNEAIQITISGVPLEDQQQINNTYPVSTDGTVRLPHIGSIQAAGSTPSVLARRIEHAFVAKQIFTNPAVNVLSSDARLKEKKISVGGHVRRPGYIPYTQGMTVWQAIQAAGGENEFGAINRVELFRKGRRMVLNLRDDQAKHTLVRENDSINVPQKNMWGQ